jgi:hypothetical protein
MPTNSLSNGDCWNAQPAEVNQPRKLHIVYKAASRFISERDTDVAAKSAWAQARDLRKQLLAAAQESPSGWAALLLWHPQDVNFVALTSRLDDVESHIWAAIRGEERYAVKTSDGSIYETRPCLPDVPVAITHMYQDGFVTEWLIESLISTDLIPDRRMRKKFAACVNGLLKEK